MHEHKDVHVYSVNMYWLGIKTRIQDGSTHRCFYLNPDIDNVRTKTLKRAREVCGEWLHLMETSRPNTPCYCEITNLKTGEIFEACENGINILDDLYLMKLMHGRTLNNELFINDNPQDVESRLLSIFKR